MINADEQRVIDVAEGTFEYQGELYTVRPAYLNTLKGKLDEDNIELTTSQADQVIQTIFGNIDRGVAEGYLAMLTPEEKTKAEKEGKVRDLAEIGVTGDGVGSDSDSGNESKATQEPQEPLTVTGKNGEEFPVQQTPLQMTALEGLRISEIEAVQSYTPNEQIAGQLGQDSQQTVLFSLVSWAVCLVALTVYLKLFKHRHKAFPVMFGAGVMSLALIVAGSLYVYNSRAWSADTWQTVAIESGYFKECSNIAREELQKVLTGIQMESGVALLNLEESVVYRDAKSIFSARLEGRELPKLEKRKKEIREALSSVLPKEPVENVNTVSDVLIERYRKVLDTPYATYLYGLRQKDRKRNLMILAGCFAAALLGLVFIWRGTKYIHRKFRGLSYGIGVAGTSFIATGIIHRILPVSLQVEPEEYRRLFQQYLIWSSENVLYFGFLLLCVSIFTWGASYVTKKNHIEKLGLRVKR